MAFDLRTCVVRVESLDGQLIAGTGFVVAPDLAVTCEHVVEALRAGPGERLLRPRALSTLLRMFCDVFWPNAQGISSA